MRDVTLYGGMCYTSVGLVLILLFTLRFNKSVVDDDAVNRRRVLNLRMKFLSVYGTSY
jgi:hypothetical protein